MEDDNVNGFFEEHSVCITDALLDAPGPHITYVNHGFEKMTGYSFAEVLGKNPRILQGPKTDRSVLARLRDNCSKGEFFEGTTINYRKDGSEFHIAWNISPIKVQGKIIAFIAVQTAFDGKDLKATLMAIKTKCEEILKAQEEILGNLIRFCDQVEESKQVNS
jgi:PAS domain S-box-containing protein